MKFKYSFSGIFALMSWRLELELTTFSLCMQNSFILPKQAWENVYNEHLSYGNNSPTTHTYCRPDGNLCLTLGLFVLIS